jgi:hypothetical protein
MQADASEKTSAVAAAAYPGECIAGHGEYERVDPGSEDFSFQKPVNFAFLHTDGGKDGIHGILSLAEFQNKPPG